MIGNLMSQDGYPNQMLPPQFAMPNVYSSFDGSDNRIRMNQIMKAQNQFVKCLNNLIRYQNTRNKSDIIILPYQNGLFYVHFKNEKQLKKIKVYESNDSTFNQLPRTMLPVIQYQPQIFMTPHYSQERMPFNLMNPVLQSQDRFLMQPKQQIQHFQKQDFQLIGRAEDSEEIESDREDEDKKSDNSFSIRKKRKILKVNDTKNITKNFSKAIISYISQNKEIGIKLLGNEQFEEFQQMLKEKKNKMTNIQQLRELWVDCNDIKTKQFNQTFRIFSQYFLKQQAVPYIYNSRILNTGWHLKYRYNLLRALKEPQNFKYIKDI